MLKKYMLIHIPTQRIWGKWWSDNKSDMEKIYKKYLLVNENCICLYKDIFFSFSTSRYKNQEIIKILSSAEFEIVERKITPSKAIEIDYHHIEQLYYYCDINK